MAIEIESIPTQRSGFAKTTGMVYHTYNWLNIWLFQTSARILLFTARIG
jgi:hypothetical protein